MFFEKITNFLTQSIYGFYNILFLLIFGILIFVDKNIEYYRGNEVYTPNSTLLLIVLVFLSLYTFKLYKFQIKESYSIKKVLKFLAVIVFILQLFIVLNIAFKAGWDVGIINNNANILVNNLDKEFNYTYFHRYPNNVFMLAFFTFIKGVGNFLSIPGFGILIFIGVLLTNISIYLTSIIAYKLTNNSNISIVTFVTATLLIGFSPWITVPYSDIYSLIFPILTLYLYTFLKGSKYPRSLIWLLIFLIPIVGYLIKPQNTIVLIAIIITELLTIEKSKVTLKNAATLLAIVIISIGSMQSLKSLSIHYTGVYPDEDVKFPMTHWLMMGLNEDTNGVWAKEDVSFTWGFSEKEVKEEQVMLEIKNRLSTMGVPGFSKHMLRKTLTNYNDGTFAWGREGNFYATTYPETIPGVSSFIRSFYYSEYNEEGTRHVYLATFQQTIWLMTLLLVLIAGFIRLKTIDKKVELIIFLSLIGVTLFSSIFEARARYLLLYAPFYVLCAMLGLYKLQFKLNRRS